MFAFFHCSLFVLIFIHHSQQLNECQRKCESQSAQLVCGADGQVYDNECLLKCENVGLIKCNKCLLEKAKKEKTNESKEHLFECNQIHGDYLMVQCHRESSYCFCVNLLNGKPIPGTSLKNQKPNCFKFLRQLKRKRRPRRGEQQHQQKCQAEDEQLFTRNLINIFVSELKRVKQKNVTKEESIEWKFSDLDSNKDSKLSKKELKHFRKMMIKIIRPTKCSQQFLRNCDSSRDQLIELDEWKSCLKANQKKPKRKPTTLDMVLMLSSYGSGTRGIPFLQASKPDDESDDEVVEDEVDQSASSIGIILSENCSASRKNALDVSTQQKANLFIPVCQAVHPLLYNQVQCHEATRSCWCVNVHNGHPIAATTMPNMQQPNCSANNKSSSSSIKGCLFRKKQRFVTELINLFDNEYKTKREKNVTTNNLTIIKWKFNELDSNANEKLERSEVKRFKQFVAQLKQMKSLRKCWRNFFRFCDLDSNQYLDESEWIQCCGEHDVSSNQRNEQQSAAKRRTNAFNGKRRGPNPFSTILKSD